MNTPWQRTLRTTFGVRRIADLWQEASGAVALEYGLIAALIAVAIIGSLGAVRDALVGLPLQSLVDAFTGVLT